MEQLTLEEIARAVGSVSPVNGKTSVICTDTRKLVKGCVFIALSGANFDGHDFVREAIEAGASVAVTEHPVGKLPCILVDNTRKALLDLARYYRMKFSPVVAGVTGSVGKTTTKEMIALALSAKYNTLKTQGNLNNEIGLPLTLFQLDSSIEAAVIEMGMSHFGEIHRLSKTARPTLAVITNIGFSHLENLGSQEGILKAKLEILDGMDSGAPLILNADDPLLAGVCIDREIISYAIENETADVRAVNLTLGEQTEFDVLYNGQSFHARLNCIGRHNVLNALAAFTAGVCGGVSPESILDKLREYRPAGLRQRIEKRGEQTLLIDCYNASPDSMKAGLSMLMQLQPEKDGRRVAVLADMLELGEMSSLLHERVGQMAVDAGIDKLICYGDNARYIARRADELGLHSGSTTDRGMLLEYLKATLKPGDVVLFKGSRGMKLEEIIEELYQHK